MENDEQEIKLCPVQDSYVVCDETCAWYCPTKQPKDGEPKGRCAIVLIAHGLKGVARR